MAPRAPWDAALWRGGTARWRIPAFLLLWGLAGAVLFSLGTRLDFLSADAFEYLSVIRNLDQGRGPLLSVKLYFMYGAPVEHYAALTRPLLFPYLASFLPGGPVFQGLIFNWLALGLGGWALLSLAGRRGGLLSFLLPAAWFFTYPVLLWAGADFLSEPSALAFLLLSILLGWGGEGRPGKGALSGAGLAAAAAVLARPASLAAVLPLAGLAAFRRGIPLRTKAFFFAGIFLGYLPYGLCNLAHGCPFLHQPQNVLWRALSFQEYFKPREFQVTAPSAWFLVKSLPGYLAGTVWKLLGANGERLLREGGTFLPFALAALLWRRFRREPVLPLWAGAVGFFLFYSCTWFVSDPPRFMLIPLVFLAGAAALWFRSREFPAGPPAGREGRKGRALLALLLLGAFGVPFLFSARFLLRGTLGGGYVSPGEVRALTALEGEVRTLLPEGAVTASGKPGPVHWIFGRPAVLLPKGLDRKGLERFLRKYRVKALVLGLGSFAGSGGEEYKGFLRGRTRKGPGGLELVVLE